MKFMLRHVPNILSALRLISAPIAAWLILHDSDFAALCVFSFAGLSDAADGYLAKTFGLTSRFGVWLDPAADKLLMLASFVSLTMIGAVPMWLTVLVIGRDIAILAGIGLARVLDAPLRIAPLLVGKIGTVVQVLYIGMVLLLLAMDWHRPVLAFSGVLAVAALAAMSIVAYGQVWLQAVAGRRRAA
jgi:cardiolipin synthase (CMP-forming)